MLIHFEFEISVRAGHIDTRAWKGVGDGGVHFPRVADFADGLHGCREIRSITRQYRPVGANLRLA